MRLSNSTEVGSTTLLEAALVLGLIAGAFFLFYPVFDLELDQAFDAHEPISNTAGILDVT